MNSKSKQTMNDTMNYIKKTKANLLDYYMTNPSLTEEIDYLSEGERLKIYTEQINQLSIQEVLEALEEVESNE